ncbi:enoyl-CoA hydratase-related protein [Nocardia salmonicida]|uniref:enoyl-CoA hydratase-related protein n=1 Tax=Nocardia salmonicida TaxID=53431 RepID=UPI0033E8D43D
MTVHVQYRIDDHIAVITLDRPSDLNAFTDDMEVQLIECFHRADTDDHVRAVVLTGSGSVFCAGLDLTSGKEGKTPFADWRASSTAPEGTQFAADGETLPIRRDGGGRVALRIFDSRKPVIAAINGHAVGVGITMTLPCDIRVVAEDAKIAFPFTRRGFVPESCSSWFLPRLVGPQRALDWMLTGRSFAASEARDAGLVLSVHPRDQVLETAMVKAAEIASGAAPVSASFARRLIWQMMTADHPMRAHQLETQALNLLGVSNDAREGVAAFLEKRTPAFRDPVSAAPDFFADITPPPYKPPVVGAGATTR